MSAPLHPGVLPDMTPPPAPQVQRVGAPPPGRPSRAGRPPRRRWLPVAGPAQALPAVRAGPGPGQWPGHGHRPRVLRGAAWAWAWALRSAARPHTSSAQSATQRYAVTDQRRTGASLLHQSPSLCARHATSSPPTAASPFPCTCEAPAMPSLHHKNTPLPPRALTFFIMRMPAAVLMSKPPAGAHTARNPGGWEGGQGRGRGLKRGGSGDWPGPSGGSSGGSSSGSGGGGSSCSAPA